MTESTESEQHHDEHHEGPVSTMDACGVRGEGSESTSGKESMSLLVSGTRTVGVGRMRKHVSGEKRRRSHLRLSTLRAMAELRR